MKIGLKLRGGGKRGGFGEIKWENMKNTIFNCILTSSQILLPTLLALIWILLNFLDLF